MNGDSKMEVVNQHLKFAKGNDILVEVNGLTFSPKDYKYSRYNKKYISDIDSNFLSYYAYLRREVIKDDLKKLDTITSSVQTFYPNHEIKIKAPVLANRLIPQIAELDNNGIKVPAKSKIIFTDANHICLFPGYVKDGSYFSYQLEQVLPEIDKKSNYINNHVLLELSQDGDLKESLVNYMRAKNKLLLKKSPNDPRLNLYMIKEETTKLESAISNQDEPLIYGEFPLIHTGLTGYKLLFINEPEAIIETDNDVTRIVNPILGSEVQTDNYNFPLVVDNKALHINYSYTIGEQGYEDFLGEPNWIIAPVRIIKRNGKLNGDLVENPNSQLV